MMSSKAPRDRQQKTYQNSKSPEIHAAFPCNSRKTACIARDENQQNRRIHLAKQRYSYEKRQRELEKKKKKEQKQQRKIEKKKPLEDETIQENEDR